jgi:Fungal specific transcription factor domain
MPICSNCTRRGQKCSLEFIAPIIRRQRTAESRFHTSSEDGLRASCSTLMSSRNGPLVDTALTASPGRLHMLGEADYELLHHYVNSAHITIAGTKAPKLWQTFIPQMAMEYPFLMGGILAVSALHLASLQLPRRQELTLRASAHESKSLPLFRSMISKTNTQNAHALFAFSGLVIPCTLSTSSNSENFGHGNLTSLPPNWFHLIRGTCMMLFSNWQTLEAGPFSPVMQQTKYSMEYISNPNDVHLAGLLPLFSTVVPVSPNEKRNLQLCLLALTELRRVSALPYSPCKTVDTRGALYIWPGTIPQGYVELLQEQHPVALIIFAHYCVFLNNVEECWYLKGHGTEMLLRIENALDTIWTPWLAWPLQQAGLTRDAI